MSGGRGKLDDQAGPSDNGEGPASIANRASDPPTESVAGSITAPVQVRAVLGKMDLTSRQLATPSPAEIESLNEIKTGLGTRFAEMIPDEAEHRRRLEVSLVETDNKSVEADVWLKKNGLVIGGLLAAGIVGALITAVVMGEAVAAGSIMAGLVIIVMTMILRRNPHHRELPKDANSQPPPKKANKAKKR